MRRSLDTSLAVARRCRDRGLQLARRSRIPAHGDGLRGRPRASVHRPRPRAGDGGGRALGLAARAAGAVAAAADVPGGDGGRRGARWTAWRCPGSRSASLARWWCSARRSRSALRPRCGRARRWSGCSRCSTATRMARSLPACASRAAPIGASASWWRRWSLHARLGIAALGVVLLAPQRRMPLAAARPPGGAIAGRAGRVCVLRCVAVDPSPRSRCDRRLQRSCRLRRAARKNQRLDHHRHRARAVQHRADVDVVELLQFEPVDRHDRIGDLHLLAQVNADQAADVAVAGQHERMAVRQHAREPLDHAAAERIEPLERRRAAPRHEQRDRLLAVGEIEPLEHRLRSRARPRRDRSSRRRAAAPARSPARCAAAARRAARHRSCCR